VKDCNMWTVALETVDKRVIMHLARMNATRDVRLPDFCTETCPVLDSHVDVI